MPTMMLDPETVELQKDAVATLSAAPLHPADANIFIVPSISSINVHVPQEVNIGSTIFGGIITGIEHDLADNTIISSKLTISIQSWRNMNTTSTAVANYATNYATNYAATNTNIFVNDNYDNYLWNQYEGYTVKLRGATVNGTTTYYVDGHQYVTATNVGGMQTKASLLKDRISRQLAVEIFTKNKFLWGIKVTDAERRARSLLHDLIGDEKFQRYIRKGFIMVEGRSGTLYKISGGHNQIISYVKEASGRFVPYETFCVVFKAYDLPFTDGVIMRKLLVEHDEFALRKLANVARVPELGKIQHIGRQQQRLAV